MEEELARRRFAGNSVAILPRAGGLNTGLPLHKNIWPWQVKGMLARACFLILGLLLALNAHAQDGTSPNVPLVKGMKLAQEGKGTTAKTRLVLNFDKAIEHRWFTLSNPARVVVDFPAVQFVTQPSLVEVPAGGLVKGMRAGVFRPGIVRMVIDLAAPARVSVFPIPAGSEGPRLVVDVTAVKPGQVPTEVAPPSDVVTTVAWAPPGVSSTIPAGPQTVEKPAEVVPPQVVPSASGPLVVTLDAGHGGVDPGACSLGVCEKQLTLDMAKRVGGLLQKKGVKVIYTRDHDVFIPLGERPRIAERAQAHLFVSLHADSHPDRDIDGATVYMVSEKASDAEAARLADAENAGDVLAGVGFENESREVQGILLSLIQRDTLNSSAYLARSVLGQIKRVTAARKPEPMFAGFKVLKAPDVPSILVEMGYLTSRSENRKLRDDAYRQRLAGAIADGVSHYLENYVHLSAPMGLKTAERVEKTETPVKRKKSSKRVTR